MPSRQLPPPAASPFISRNHNHNQSHDRGDALLHRSHLIPPLAAVGALLSVVLVIFILYRKLSRNRTAPAPPSDHQNNLPSTKQPLQRYCYSVLRRSTSSLAASNRLGQGGFGSVYRGVLPSSGQSVAVKVMDTADSIQGEREFQNELSLAARINDEATSCSQFLVRILGYSSDKRGQRKLLVYELMTNGSLQEKLLDQKCEELLVWEKRFKVVLGVAKALEYLHFMCGETPVIHGDVKPSNVLLDAEFNAKLGDFGLARILEPDWDGGDDIRVLLETEAEGGAACKGVAGTNDAGSGMEETESVVTGIEETTAAVADRSPTSDFEASPSEGFEKASLSESSCLDKISVESENNRRVGKKKKEEGGGGGKGIGSGRDWWWKQDNVGSLDSGRVKDYVMEWIGNEINKERPKSSKWIGDSGTGADAADSSNAAGNVELVEPKKKKRIRLDWWATSPDEDNKMRKKEKNQKPREWWKEEFCEELSNKKKKKKRGEVDLWWQRDDDFTPERKKKKKKKKRKTRSNLGSIDWWLDGLSGEFRGGGGGGGGRRNSQDTICAGIPKSGGISSTPSMRGTVCYIAPEYGGGGQISEKCDVYSFGVLVLVVVSGRRPLQVMASPMSEFDRANLISWARQLAYNGKLLDLVDPTIQSLDREHVMLCITIALLCLQRSPGKRPNMKEIVEMLTGVVEPPNLPFEFSPSPPSNISFKSKNKQPR